MNSKAEKFLVFLKEQDIKVFEVAELEDEFKTTIFRSRMEVAGQLLPTVVLLDESIYPLVRVQIVDKAVKGESLERVLAYTNELNGKYKIFKYYVTAEGALMLDCCLPSNTEKFDGELVRVVLDVVLKHLIEEYPNLMTQVWGEGQKAN